MMVSFNGFNAQYVSLLSHKNNKSPFTIIKSKK